MITEDDKKLISRYFVTFPDGSDIPLNTHDLFTYEQTFRSFADCDTCGCTVHIDNMLKHAQWHETLEEKTKEIIDVLNSYAQFMGLR